MINSSAFAFVAKLVRELFDKFDLLIGQIVDVCELSLELIFDSCLRFGLGGSNAHPFTYVLLYLLAVSRFGLNQWIKKKRELRSLVISNK